MNNLTSFGTVLTTLSQNIGNLVNRVSVVEKSIKDLDRKYSSVPPSPLQAQPPLQVSTVDLVPIQIKIQSIEETLAGLNLTFESLCSNINKLNESVTTLKMQQSLSTVPPSNPPFAPAPKIIPSNPPVAPTPEIPPPPNPPVAPAPEIPPSNPPVAPAPEILPSNPPVAPTPLSLPSLLQSLPTLPPPSLPSEEDSLELEIGKKKDKAPAKRVSTKKAKQSST